VSAVTATAPSAEAPAQPAKSKSAGFKIANVGTVVMFGVIMLWCLLPFYWMIVLAFRDPSYTFDTTPFFSHVTMSNLRFAFSGQNAFGRSIVNSLFIGVTVTAVAMIIGVSAAYALARLSFRGKGILLAAILASSMFPGVAILTPLFQLFSGWGWVPSYQGLILPQISFSLPLAVYTLTSFFSDMPWELEQAARVDGATPAQAFRLVILPLAAPAMFTTSILVLLASWNEYLLSSVISRNDLGYRPSTVAIANFSGGPHIQPFTQIMAAGLVVTLPLIIIVLLAQRRIVSGLTAGGVKG
jgi:multiple sugar transport system permease protein